MIKLLYMYKTEIAGKSFKGKNRQVTPYEALIYKWNGRNKALKEGIVDPDTNAYINTVKKTSKEFGFYTTRK